MRMSVFALLCVLVPVATVVLTGPSSALGETTAAGSAPQGPQAGFQGGPQSDAAFAAQVAAWQKVLDKAAGSLTRANLSEADYETLRTALAQVFEQARKASAQAVQTVAGTRPMLEALGPKPAENGPSEAEAVAAERERLEDIQTTFDGRARQADLVATRADILQRTANERRINQFAETLFLRGVSPLAPETFQRLPVEVQFLHDRLTTAIATVIGAGLPKREHGIQFGVLAVLALVVGWLVRRHVGGRFGQREAVARPCYRQRVGAAAAESVARGLQPVLVVVAAAAVALEALDGLPSVSVLMALVRSMAGGVVAFVLIAGLGRALLAVRRPAWRLFGVEDRAARALAFRFTVFALALAVAGAVLAFLEAAVVPPELHAVTSFAAKLLGALAVLAMVLPDRVWRAASAVVDGDENATPLETVTLAPRLRALVSLVAVAVVALAVLRYHNFGFYLAEMTLAGLAVIGLLLLLRGVGREGLQRLGGGARQALFHSDRDVKLFEALSAGVLDLLLLALGVAMLLPLSGIAWSEFAVWGGLFLRGVRVGEVTLSPVDLVSALVLVVVIMAATRFVQRQLDDRVLQHLQIDRGVRHSIRTGIGYFGALAAILVGIATLGLSLSNLALIAGALSVGIGFGLQAIVSNFVAGLILLVERPLKVGDWIVIGEYEGVVKRISVRATEIQTFQHASVIIPNSELIAKAVKNWTYKDKFGRLDVPVSVGYGCDPFKVRDVLLACAAADFRITAQPMAQVVFRNFGESALEFELRCFVTDIESYRAVTSDLRFAILKAFRDNSIEMPFPQRVIHVPELERLVALASRAP